MKNNIKPTLVLSTICVVVALLLSAINMITGPIIEAQRNAAANGALLEVMPAGSGFEELDIASLGLPAAVTNVYKETSGKGYVFRVSSTGYKPGMIVMVGVDSEGKVTGSKCLESNETWGQEATLDGKYNGQSIGDAALIIAAGATAKSATSNGYFAAIEAALQANVLVGGGELDPAIELKNLIPSLHTGLASGGQLKATEIAPTGNIKLGYKALNGSGYAFIVASGEAKVLALVNASGVCKVYDTTGADVTDANAAVVEEVLAAAGEPKSFAEAAEKKIISAYADASDITPMSFTTFGNVVYAASFKSEGNTYYAFYSTPLTYEDSAMAVCTIIDANGAIVNQSVQQFVFGHSLEYIPVIKDYVNLSGQAFKDYIGKYDGLTGDQLSDELLITGATLSSSAVKLGTKEAFDIYNLVKGGEQ